MSREVALNHAGAAKLLYLTSTLGKLHLGDAALGQCQLRAVSTAHLPFAWHLAALPFGYTFNPLRLLP